MAQPANKPALQHDTKTGNGLLQQLSDLASNRLLHILTQRQAEITKLKPDDPPWPIPQQHVPDCDLHYVPFMHGGCSTAIHR